MDTLLTISLFMALGSFFILVSLVFGKTLRPHLPTPEKNAPYECGEVPVGNSWVQFDLRFYIVALVFLVFDVEVALFYPWATVYQNNKLPALLDMLVFFAILLVGYVYLWRFGYLDWVRSSVTTSLKKSATTVSPAQLAQLARKDPETLKV